MDNRVFNVNGSLDKYGKAHLLLALELAFRQGESGFSQREAVGYRIDPKLGFVLYKYDSPQMIRFPCGLGAKQVLPLVLSWFESRPVYEAVGWDSNCDHDGENGPGWRVYCEDWGHVGNERSAFLAIKPAFMWYGK